MGNEPEEAKEKDAVLKALDLALQQGAWEESTFLRIIGKNLQQIRDEYAAALQDVLDEQSATPDSALSLFSANPAKQEVFVALYSTEGGVLASWERIVNNLPSQIISRPVYAKEADIIDIIKTKENKVNEAYVAVIIDRDDILVASQDRTLQDKLGKPLITLKNKAIVLANITRFVHLSATYRLVNTRFVKT